MRGSTAPERLWAALSFLVALIVVVPIRTAFYLDETEPFRRRKPRDRR